VGGEARRSRVNPTAAVGAPADNSVVAIESPHIDVVVARVAPAVVFVTLSDKLRRRICHAA
jgi:hypothetical protein